jgi:hypothetical protein
MSPASSTPSSSSSATSRIPTAQDVSTSGGVWAPTSAKRDKLVELKAALVEGQATLDDAATPEQLLDLYLADGIQLIAKTVDSKALATAPQIVEFQSWLDEQRLQRPSGELVGETELKAYLEQVERKITLLQSNLPPSLCLREVRDFLDPEKAHEEELQKIKPRTLSHQDASFEDAVSRFRLQVAKAAAEHLKTSWKVLTTVSDADVDRAAVQGTEIQREATTVPLLQLNTVLRTFASGSCVDRVDAMWDLLDRDLDGLLDETEMNQVAFLSIAPVSTALLIFFQEALDAYPVRAPLPVEAEDGPGVVVPPPPQARGWRQTRKQAKIAKNLSKDFRKTCKNHFDDEVEINHRLRCIYAWAEKAHQDNKIDSVTVDSGWSGRKRYVELHPKIALPEFREVQQMHFTHLDRVGVEILKSFREDLWVTQGKGRQNRELMRDCALFLAVVSAVDYVILML